MDEIAFLDATDQADLVRRKEVSPGELVEAAIGRAERLNPQLNAIIAVLFDQAREAANELPLDGPFAGVPFVLKDLLIDCAGTPRSDGSSFLAGRHVSASDSELVRRFKRAGLVAIGKSNSSEFGLLPTTEPECYGPTCNPWDIRLGSGGSSGGSAAAVASGMVPVAHASDGGGSIRIPASCCGLVGLKPTRGRNSLGPEFGDIAGGIICEHVVTRSVRDSAAILDATAGPMAGEPYTPAAVEGSFVEQMNRKPTALRIGFGSTALTGTVAHQDCTAAVQATARLCEQLGHRVEEASPSVDSQRLFRAFGAVLTGYLGCVIKTWVEHTGFEPAEQHFEAATWRMYQHSLKQSGGDYLFAIKTVQQCCRQFARFFEPMDIWLTPTLVRPPAPLGYFKYSYETRRQHNKRLGDYTGFTLIANASGQPAISLPLHWNDDNLPIGVQLTARYGAESTLLNLAAQLEQACPWSHRRPPVNAASATG